MKGEKSWLEVSVVIDESAIDSVSNLLFELGCKGVIFENDLEKRIKFGISNDSKGIVRTYFPNDSTFPKKLKAIKSYLNFLKTVWQNVKDPKIYVEEIPDEDWGESHREFFLPYHVTERIVVKPEFHEYIKKGGEIVITINPGLAFGIGTHATTKMCVEAIEFVLSTKKIKRHLDVGVGTGILILSSLSLGADFGVGVDIDPKACQIAKKNLYLNGFSKRGEIICGSIDSIKGNFDLVTANILLETILDMESQLVNVVCAHGHLAVSGILEEEVSKFEKSFIYKNLSLVYKKVVEEWVLFLFVKDGCS